MLETPSEITRLLKDEQSSKAFSPTLLTLSGITIPPKEEQP